MPIRCRRPDAPFHGRNDRRVCFNASWPAAPSMRPHPLQDPAPAPATTSPARRPMRLSSPRIAPVPQAQWTPEQAELAAPILARRGEILNIFRTQLVHPDARRGFLGLGSYVLSKRNTLPARERELVILRMGYLCRSGYEWTQHRRIGLNAGLGEAEVERIKRSEEHTSELQSREK